MGRLACAALLLPLAAGCTSVHPANNLAQVSDYALRSGTVTLHFADRSSLAVTNPHFGPDTSWAFVPARGTVVYWPTRHIDRVTTRSRVLSIFAGLAAGFAVGTVGSVAMWKECDRLEAYTTGRDCDAVERGNWLRMFLGGTAGVLAGSGLGSRVSFESGLRMPLAPADTTGGAP